MNEQVWPKVFAAEAGAVIPYSAVEPRFQRDYLLGLRLTRQECLEIEEKTAPYPRGFSGSPLIPAQSAVVEAEETLKRIRKGWYGDVGYNDVENALPTLKRVATAIELVTQKFREVGKPDNLLDRLAKLQDRIDTVVAQFHPDGLVISVEEYEAKVAASADVEAQFQAGATNTPLVLTPAQRIEADPNAPRVAAE